MSWLVLMALSVKWELSKVLGTAFGLSLDVHDVDEFLVGKLQEYYLLEDYLKHLSLARRRLFVNYVMASTLWFFVFGLDHKSN